MPLDDSFIGNFARMQERSPLQLHHLQNAITKELKMASIQIVRAGKLAFSPKQLGNPEIRGIETAMIQLSRALQQRGHQVTVYSAHAVPENDAGVEWQPFDTKTILPPADVSIVINDHVLLRQTNAMQRIMWLHNMLPFEKFVRKGFIAPCYRFKPLTIVSSEYHAAKKSRLVAPFGKQTIPLGIPEVFLKNTIVHSVPPPPHAAFLTQRYRGFERLENMWDAFAPKARLTALFGVDADAERLAAKKIEVCESLPWTRLADFLKTLRVAVFPWDKPETFCLAAAEAQAMGVPILTMNTGAIAERVQHGTNGMVANTPQQFKDFLEQVLFDDVLWRRLHLGAIASRTRYCPWDVVASKWETLFNTLSLATHN